MKAINVPQMLDRFGYAIALAILLVTMFSAVGHWLHVEWLALDSSCVQKAPTDDVQKAIASLDSNIDLGIKLSTSIVGAGAALLLGLKKGVVMQGWLQMIFITSLIPFAQSALYGVWWRLEISLVWIRQCPELLQQHRVVAIYQTSLTTFVEGSLGIIIFLIILTLSRSTMRNDETSEKADV